MAAASITTAAPELLESADEDGLTPLHLAVIQGNIALVNLLLANKANVNAVDNEGHSVVHWAAGQFSYKVNYTRLHMHYILFILFIHNVYTAESNEKGFTNNITYYMNRNLNGVLLYSNTQ